MTMQVLERILYAEDEPDIQEGGITCTGDGRRALPLKPVIRGWRQWLK